MVITNQGDSKVGKAHLYESGDQKNLPRDQRTADADLRRKVGTEERTHANPDPNKYNTMNYTSGMDANHTHKTTPQKKKAAHAREVERQTEQQKKDPTLPAQMHFNKPGTGPRIDKELMEDDAKMLDKKDKQRERKAKGKQADIEREIEREARSVSVEA